MFIFEGEVSMRMGKKRWTPWLMVQVQAHNQFSAARKILEKGYTKMRGGGRSGIYSAYHLRNLHRTGKWFSTRPVKGGPLNVRKARP